jgi:hypothetical protein
MFNWFGWIADSAVDWLPVVVSLLTLLSIGFGALGLVFASAVTVHAVREGRERRV